jgi:Protein of unknown function (DUF3060)
MKRFALASVLLLALSGTAAAEIYADNNKTVTQDCAKDPDARIDGNNNKITFTGPCKRISVAGNKNTVKATSLGLLHIPGNKNTATVDAVDSLILQGNDNNVTWTKGLTARGPSISNPGTGNKIGNPK